MNQIEVRGFSMLYLDGGRRRRLTKTYYTGRSDRSYNVALELNSEDSIEKYECFRLDVKRGAIGSLTNVEKIPPRIKSQVDEDVKHLYQNQSDLRVL